MSKYSAFFKFSETGCKCGCGYGAKGDMDLAVMMVATAVRIHFGKPVTITSGARCAAHNKAVGGASASQHTQARALDFQVSGVAPAAVQAWIIDAFPLVSVGKGKTFTHIDTRPGNRVVFNY